MTHIAQAMQQTHSLADPETVSGGGTAAKRAMKQVECTALPAKLCKELLDIPRIRSLRKRRII